MKTQIQISRKRFSASAILFILASFMGINFLSSCQKEDTSSMAPSSDAAFASSDENRSANAATPAPVIQMTKETCFGSCAAYTVSVFATGDVLFEGKAHVAVIGSVKSRLSISALKDIMQLFEVYHFMDMRDSYAGNVDMQRTTTFFANQAMSKSVSDYGINVPSELVLLQKQIIRQLKIEKYIDGKSNVVSSSGKSRDGLKDGSIQPYSTAPSSGVIGTDDSSKDKMPVDANLFHARGAQAKNIKVNINELQKPASK